MNQLFIKYQRAVNKLPTMAKGIILTAVLGFVFVLWRYAFWQPAQLTINTHKEELKVLETVIPLLKTKVQTLKKSISERKKLISDAKIKFDSKKQNAATPKLSSPQTTARVLQDLLSTRHNLNLIDLKTLPPTIEEQQSEEKFLKYGIVLKFQGDYFSTMSYMRAIESLNWKIFWDKMEYQTIKYPLAEITIRIHTLSNKGDWVDA